MAGAHNDSILASSFHLPSLVYAQQYRPGFPLVYNMEPEHSIADAEEAISQNPFLYGLCLHKDTLDEAMVEFLRGRHKRIAVYTCNSEEEIVRALALGVDILISDVPQYALQLRDARAGR
jgi:glycerophosphoryl diester phosphodiesterase